MENPLKDDSIALWRYGLISPLLVRDPSGKTLEELLQEAGETSYVKLDGTITIVSPETLRKWLYRFRVSGLAGLENQERSDKGCSHIPEKLQETIRQCRVEHPRWTLQVIFDHLLKEGHWDGKSPSQSALYRFCYNQNLQRDPHLNQTPCKSFEFSAFGQLWIADFLHGPKLWHGSKKGKTYLHAIIDDASRYVVQAQFHLSEGVESMLADFKTAVRRFGIPQRFYSDNGSAYKSRHLKLVGARLKIHLPHTPPYRPQGRGKIERFFRTLSDQFLSVYSFKTLDEINKGLNEWLAKYHQTVHQSINATPLSRRLSILDECRKLPETTFMDPLFSMKRQCRVYKNGTIRIQRIEFEVPGCTVGERIDVYYLPWNLSKVWCGSEFTPVIPLDKYRNAQRFEAPQHIFKKEISHERE